MDGNSCIAEGKQGWVCHCVPHQVTDTQALPQELITVNSLHSHLVLEPAKGEGSQFTLILKMLS